HERRMCRAFNSIGIDKKINLDILLKKIEVPTSGWWKCRLLYNEKDEEISFEKYQPRAISSLKIVHDDAIDYPHKYVDRSRREKLLQDQVLTPTEITLSNIHTFEKVKLINALLGFDGPEIEIKNIVF